MRNSMQRVCTANAMQKLGVKGRSQAVVVAAKLLEIAPSYRLISPTLDMINDDEQLDNFIKENFDHNHHQQSSLRIAPLSQGGVVDRYGRVHGVNQLIVADDSIIPFTVDGNTSAPAFLIGYTIAKQLLRENRN